MPYGSEAHESFLNAVRMDLGDASAESSELTIEEYGRHSLPFPDTRPVAVVYPASLEEVRTVVLHARRFGVPLYPISGGQNLGLGYRSPVYAGQVVVDLGRRMNRIVEINEELGYCVIEPGVTFRSMYEALNDRGSSLMISPTAGPSDGSMLGNALDKGGGSGPYGDHFGMTCGMEVVLGSGEVVRTGEGSLDTETHLNWHVTKYSFGPALDGLFTQSNFGIVTRIGVWLMKRPPLIHPFFITFENEEDIGEIVDLIRPLKANGKVPTLIRATSDLYLLASQESAPDYRRGAGPQTIADDTRLELRKRYGIGAWTVSGAVYGAKQSAIGNQISELRAHFSASQSARFIEPEEAVEMPIFRVARNSNAGIPNDGELGMLDWRPGGGAIWLTPGFPMIGSVVRDFCSAAAKTSRNHGIDYMASLVCGHRFARAVHSLIYDRQSEDEARRADKCYRSISEIFRSRGVFVGRAPTKYQALHHGQRTSEVIEMCSRLKRALDPDGIIAPGRYGIE